ncbi:MAG TPA: ribosome biogenesis factor YjgA [Casimicrobiaceae bacterium]|nr:ribosome biogenesis factor YjgA [Casimicrobiaceae bacterium]
MPRPQPPAPDGGVPETASKTRRKLEMHELQDLGVALVALDARRLATLELPEALVDAIALARRTNRHEARRRQMQYIGRLMRDVDPAPIRAALAAWGEGSRRDRERFALVERWRDRLLDEADGMQAFVTAYPGAPHDTLAALVAAARAERARGAPPAKSRALFRELKRITENEST